MGSQLKVFVLVQHSAPFNAFDISLFANHTILKPVDAVDSGGLLSGGNVVVKCIGGVAVSGNCSTVDSLDTIHLAETGPFPPLSTGLLFTAIYNITGSANTPIGFQTGCTRSSVNGTSVCVSFGDGTVSILQETVQGTTFTLRPTPTFNIATLRPDILLAKGETGNATIVLTSVNGFSGSVTLSTTFSPKVNHPPVVSLTSTTVRLTSGAQLTTVLVFTTKNNTTQATYEVTVTGTSGTLSGTIQEPVTVIA